jgi:AcrR family transcriptional regulator
MAAAPRQRSRPGRPAGRRLPAAQRRAQLLDVAAEILREGGPGALTMERLAERANVSKGLGYAYFRDADEVALTLWDREVAQVYERVEQATSAAADFEEGLRRAVHAYFEVVAERGELLGTLRGHFGSRGERRIRRRVRRFLDFWARRVSQAVAVEPGVATALAAMMLNAADACVQGWGAGLLGRDEAERLCADFMARGMSGAAAAHDGPRKRRGGGFSPA